MTAPLPISGVADAAQWPRPVWGSERAYVLATIAGVVGLGNLWRFPYMLGQHGGGNFLVAYAVCVGAIGIPLAALESAAGALVRRSPVGTHRRATGRIGATLGWAVIGLTVAILSYYFVITGWTLGYAADAVTGDLRAFDEFRTGYRSLWLFAAIGAATMALLIRGVKALERASLYLVPVLVLLVVVLAVYSQSLDGAGAARSFVFGFDAEGLGDSATWRAAAGQAFYSIGVGQGVLIAYGSFIPAGTNIIRSTTMVGLTNAGVSIVSGVMVMAVAITFDVAPSAGAELSFTAFPRVFAQVPGGDALAIVFFALLLLAGFTSCLGATVVVVSAVRDEVGFTHRRATVVTVLVVCVLGLPSALSFTDVGLSIGDRPFLEIVDQATGSGAIVVLGLVGAGLLALRLPRRSLRATFGADPMRIGPLRLGPGTVIAWATLLPATTLVGWLALGP